MALSFPALDAAAAANFAGQQLLTQQQTAEADLDFRRQQTQRVRTENMLQQQALKNRQDMSQWLQGEQAKSEQPYTSATDLAKLYGKASQQALLHGDFDGAAEMDKLAKGQLDLADKEAANLEKERLTKSEALSTAAQDVQTNPTPENHQRLVRSAIAAGVNPADIPLPSDPAYKTFVTQSSLAPLKGKDRLQYLETVRQHEETERLRKQAEADRHQEREDARKDRAAAREDMRQYRSESLALRKQLAESTMAARKEKQEAGGEIRRRNTIAAVNYANETVRGLDLIGTMSKGQTGSIFAHLSSADDLSKALRNMGGNRATPEMQQIYQTATKGLGLEMAQLATAGSGRAPNKDIIKEMAAMVEAQPGDKQYEMLFKVANAADFVRERLKAVPKSPDPEIQKTREEAEKRLENYPHPTQIIEAARAAGLKTGTIKGKVTTMRTQLDRLMNQEQASAPPEDIQALLDQYAPNK